MNPIELGKFIALLRNEKGLTQEELAEKLFIDKRKVSRWECGTSTPEFEMLIKLSEILNVSLYELSICKKIEHNKINELILNKFKNIKDFKKYKIKKKIFIILIIIILIIFLFSTIYTISQYGTVRIYKIKSLNEQYTLKGNLIVTKKYKLFNIIDYKQINDNEISIFNSKHKCQYEIYNGKNRIANLSYNENEKSSGISIKLKQPIDDKKDFTINVNCIDEKNQSHSFSNNFQIIKEYDNRLF